MNGKSLLPKQLLCLVVLSASTGFAQMPATAANPESFTGLPDDVFRREIATFSHKARSLSESGADSIRLNEIPLYRWSKEGIAFERGNRVSTDKYISIGSVPFDPAQHAIVYDSTGSQVLSIDGRPAWGAGSALPATQVSYVHFVRYKYPHDVPDSAVTGLYEPNFGDGEPGKRGRTAPVKQYCRVYESADQQRLYIHMLNGSGANAYEVTWVYDNAKYILQPVYKMRVVDALVQ